MIKEETELTTSAIKMQTLLHQFIQLYDRLTVEHSLMTDRELKLIKNLASLRETIQALNQLSPQIIDTIQDTAKKEVDRVCRSLFTKIENVQQNINNIFDAKLDDCCNKLNSESTKIAKLGGDCWQLTTELGVKSSWRMLFIFLLSGLVSGLIIGYFILKRMF
jgi:DNA anti-recombination protein RmuC